jgi:hypothetical protein
VEAQHASIEQLSALIDGQLDADEERAVRAHLAACGPCAAEVEQLRSTVGLLRALPAAAPPRSFLVSRESRKRPALFGLPAWLFPSPMALRGLAGAALALMLVLFVTDARVQSPASQHAVSLSAPAAAPAASDAASDAAANQAARSLAPAERVTGSGAAAAGSEARSAATPDVVPGAQAPAAPAAQVPSSAPAGAAATWTAGRVGGLLAAVAAGMLLVTSFVIRRRA